MSKKTYKIGVSGHRDLKRSEIPQYREKIRAIIKEKREEYDDREITIITPLAEGADQLVANVAKELGVGYEVILPLPLELYRKDFSQEAYEEFYALYSSAKEIATIPIPLDTSIEEMSDYGKKRDTQYLKVGQEVVERSDFMIFLWDSIVNHKRGGTADIFHYAKERYGASFNKQHLLIKSQRES